MALVDICRNHEANPVILQSAIPAHLAPAILHGMQKAEENSIAQRSVNGADIAILRVAIAVDPNELFLRFHLISPCG